MADESTVSVSDSILDSVKQLIGIDPSYTPFDVNIISYINTSLRTLNQIGVGTWGVSITDNTTTWDDFLDDATNLDMAKTFVADRVHLYFDPPSSGSAMQALKENLDEELWRLNVQVDPYDMTEE